MTIDKFPPEAMEILRLVEDRSLTPAECDRFVELVPGAIRTATGFQWVQKTSYIQSFDEKPPRGLRVR